MERRVSVPGALYEEDTIKNILGHSHAQVQEAGLEGLLREAFCWYRNLLFLLTSL